MASGLQNWLWKYVDDYHHDLRYCFSYCFGLMRAGDGLHEGKRAEKEALQNL